MAIEVWRGHLRLFEFLTRRQVGRARTATILPPAVLRHDFRLEWNVITTSHHNLLLSGSSSATDAVLHALEPHLCEPVVKCKPKAGIELPQPNEGTLILSEIAGLDSTQQAQMLQWLNRVDTRVQVICTSSEPLFALVQAGGFLNELYYRLNVMRLDVPPSDDRLS